MKFEHEIQDGEFVDLIDTVRSCYHDLLGEPIKYSKAILLVGQIPVDIMLEVIKWGANDTVVRDSIYRWIQNRFSEVARNGKL